MAGSGVTGGEKEEMLAIGKKRWPAMGGVFRNVESGYALRRSSKGGNFPDGLPVIWGVYDYVFRVPIAAPTPGRIGQNGYWTSGCGNLLEIPGSEEDGQLPLTSTESEICL